MVVVKTQQQEAKGDNLDDLITQVFQTKNETSDRNPTIPTAGKPDQSCTCVAYYLCNNGTINKDGTGIIDIR